jgi:uncharacterized membrane protein
MTESGRFLLATLMGLVLAALVHVGVVLGVPWMGERDAFSRLRSTMSAERSELVSSLGSETWLPQPDPAVAIAACAYNLGEGPIRIASRTGSLFESVSFHGRAGGVYYAITDRAAVRGVLEILVMTKAQYDEALAREDEEDPSRDLRVVSPSREGLVIVRVLAATASQRGEAEEAARGVSCVIEPQAPAPGQTPPQKP